MRESWAVAIGVAVLAIGVWLPERAECCTIGPGGGAPSIDVKSPADQPIPPEGAVVFPVEAHGADADAFEEAVSMQVRGASGDRLSGEARLVEVREVLPDAYRNHDDHPFQRWLLVWTSDVRMLVNSRYEAKVSMDGDSEFFEFRTGDGELRELPSIEDVRMTNVHEMVSLAGATDCDGGDGGECPSCRFTDEFDAIRIRARMTDDEYRRPDVLYELRPLDPEPAVHRRAAHWGGTSTDEDAGFPASAGPDLHYRPTDEDICLQLVARSLVDDSERVADEFCLEGHHAPPDDIDVGFPPPDTGSDTGRSPYCNSFGPCPETGIDPVLRDTSPEETTTTEESDTGDTPNLPWGGAGDSDGCNCSNANSTPPAGGWLWLLVLVVGATRLRSWRPGG